MREDLAALAEKLYPGALPVEREHGDFVSVAYVFPLDWSGFLPHRRTDGCVTAYFGSGYHKSAGTPVIVASTLPKETVPIAYVPFLNLPVADIPPEALRYVMRSRAEESGPKVDLDVHHSLYANMHEDGKKIIGFEYLKIYPHLLSPGGQTMVLAGIYQKEEHTPTTGTASPTPNLPPPTA